MSTRKPLTRSSRRIPRPVSARSNKPEITLFDKVKQEEKLSEVERNTASSNFEMEYYIDGSPTTSKPNISNPM